MPEVDERKIGAVMNPDTPKAIEELVILPAPAQESLVVSTYTLIHIAVDCHCMPFAILYDLEWHPAVLEGACPKDFPGILLIEVENKTL